MSQPLNTSTQGILKMALPIAMGSFVQFCVVFVDNFFLSKVDDNALNGAGQGGLVYLALTTLGIGLGSGIQILVARRAGENREAAIPDLFTKGIALGLALSGLLLILSYASLDTIASSWFKYEGIADNFVSFMNVRLWGLPVYITLMVLNGLFMGLGKTMAIGIATVVMALSNIGLDWVLINGELGMPKMGVQGAAMASFLSECIAVGIGFFWLVKPNIIPSKSLKNFAEQMHLRAYLPKAKFLTQNASNYLKILKISLPLMGQMALSISSWSVFFFMVEKIGEAETFVSHIVRSLYILGFVSIYGFAQTAKTYVSGLIGEGNQNLLRRTLFKIIVLNIVGVFLLCHGLLFYPELLGSIFTDVPETLEMVGKTLRVIFGALMIHAAGSVLLSTLEGAGMTMHALVIEIIAIGSYFYFTYQVTIVNVQPIHLIWMNDYVYFGGVALLSAIALWVFPWKTAKV